MKKSEAEHVEECIDNEGMWYCFDSYSFFPEIRDKDFHRLRQAFIDAGETLKRYVEKQKTEGKEDEPPEKDPYDGKNDKRPVRELIMEDEDDSVEPS